MSSWATSSPSLAKKPSSIAAIAGKYEFETRSGTAILATLTRPPGVGTRTRKRSLRYEARRIDVVHAHRRLELEDAVDDIDGFLDAGRLDHAQLLAFDLRQFRHGLGLAFCNRDLDRRVIFVHDSARLIGIGKGVLHAADRRGDKAPNNVGLCRDGGVGRDDAVAIEAYAGIREGEAHELGGR